MDRGAWWATVHDVAELAMTEAAKLTSMLGFLIRSDEFLSLPILLNTHTHTHTHTHGFGYTHFKHLLQACGFFPLSFPDGSVDKEIACNAR